MKEKILVSACLLGEPCRYDGASKPCREVIELREIFRLIPICPEVEGGLSTPRLPAERVHNRVFCRDGKDVSENYRKGAEKSLKKYLEEGCVFAVLKEKSPSCGKNLRYDGSFSETLVKAPGVTAELLMKNHIPIFSEEEIKRRKK